MRLVLRTSMSRESVRQSEGEGAERREEGEVEDELVPARGPAAVLQGDAAAALELELEILAALPRDTPIKVQGEGAIVMLPRAPLANAERVVPELDLDASGH